MARGAACSSAQVQERVVRDTSRKTTLLRQPFAHVSGAVQSTSVLTFSPTAIQAANPPPRKHFGEPKASYQGVSWVPKRVCFVLNDGYSWVT